jgi:hypothetical protein
MVDQTKKFQKKTINMIRKTLLCIAASLLLACGNEDLQSTHQPPTRDKPVTATDKNSNRDQPNQYKSYKVFKPVSIAGKTIQIYVALDYDVAFIGMAIKSDDGEMLYCPLYGSTYEGIPAVVLTASVIESRQQLWLESSWEGSEVLGMINADKPTCTTRYGELAFEDKPIPASFGGSKVPFPSMEQEKISKVYSIQYETDN